VEPNRRSHFEIIAKPTDRDSNRKSSKEVAPRSSNCYIQCNLGEDKV